MAPVFTKLQTLEIPQEGSHSFASTAEKGEPYLHSRIVRRAQEIKIAWQSSGEETQDQALLFSSRLAMAAGAMAGSTGTTMPHTTPATDAGVSGRTIEAPRRSTANLDPNMTEYEDLSAELKGRGWVVIRDRSGSVRVQHADSKQLYDIESTRLPSDVREKATRVAQLQSSLPGR
jgi:hypothetical protein